MTVNQTNGSVRVRTRMLGLGAWLGSVVLVGAITGCGLEEGPEDTTDDLQVTTAAQTTLSGSAGYATECSAAGVPLPPSWGGSGNPNWSRNGSPTNSFTDGFAAVGTGHIYYHTFTNANANRGICVINAHDSPSGLPKGLFDVICQGINGKACFWEGVQPSAPPATAVALAPPGSGTPFVKGGTDLEATSCTKCHAGDNVFVTHNKPGHPTNGTALANWRPTAWPDPITTVGAVQNSGPDPLASYPPSTSGCQGCHTAGGIGGRFPRLSRNEYRWTPGFLSVNTYCDILATVTNLPGAQAGMPPGNTCTPNVDCAAQTDPFVRAMLDTCSGVGNARSNSPVGLQAYGSTNPFSGSWDHLMADLMTADSRKILQFNNQYSLSGFAGWTETDVSGTLNTRYRTTMWLKGDGFDGSALSIASTDPFGSIWEMTAGGNVNSVTVNAPSGAAGSPYAYIRHDGYNTIVFRGFDTKIYESYWDGASWQTNQLPGQGTSIATGDPIGYVRDSSSSVIFNCGTYYMCEERLVNGTWFFRQLSLNAFASSFVARPFSRQSEFTIFYTASDGVHAVTDNSEPWFGTVTDTLISADPDVVSAAIPFNDQLGRPTVVYITDGGGTRPSKVMQLQRPTSTSGWSLSTLVTAQKSTETLVGDPSAYLASASGQNTIHFRNATGQLYQLRWNYTNKNYTKTTLSPF